MNHGLIIMFTASFRNSLSMIRTKRWPRSLTVWSRDFNGIHVVTTNEKRLQRNSIFFT